MKNSNLLITGGLGFIGSNYIEFLLSSKKNINIINIDKETKVSNLKINRKFIKFKNYKYYKADINNTIKIKKIISKHKIDNVIHFAAESHVDNSIVNPQVFVKSNINGTYNLLYLIYKHWMISPNKVRKKYIKSKFIHISTDEIYGSIKKNLHSLENDPLFPSSVYSASKASSDHLVYSFYKTFGLKTIITNCTNNYGKNQNEEKFIPRTIYNLTNNKKIPIYGKGDQIRNWLHVYDHCKAIYLIFKKGKVGERYNIASNNEYTNLEVVNIIINELSKIFRNKNLKNLVQFIKDRPGHDFRYALNYNKIKLLGWKPSIKFKDGIKELIEIITSKKNEK